MSDNTTIELGDYEFNPIESGETSDFRLGIEGASGTGKTNTMAVIIEDLADSPVPMLVLERLSLLSPVREIVDDFIVVGGRKEDGIDLVVPIEGIETVAEMVMEKGLNVIVELGTYKNKEEPETQFQHKAAGKILARVNEIAENNLRTGNRRQVNVIADEIHMLAPERGSKLVKPRDQWVELCNSELNTMATEGGNKGINLIGSYQRRSYTDKALVTQFDNLIVHRLGEKDRKDAAKEIGVSKDEIQSLGTGEIYIYGDTTDQVAEGPTKVRERHSPDPRQETFDPAEPPEELSDVVDEFQEKVDEQVQQKKQRQDRIEKLERDKEQLEEELEEKKEELQDTQRLAKSLKNLGESGDEDAQQIKEKVEELQEKNKQVRKEKQQLEEDKKELQQELEKTQERVQKVREEYREDSQAVHKLQDALQELINVPETSVDETDVDMTKIERKIDKKIEKKVRDRPQVESNTPDDLQEVILNDFQQTAIDSLEETVDELKTKQYRLISYLEAKGKGSGSMTELLRECLGYENPGSSSREYVKDLVEKGLMRKDKAGNIYPNLKEKVEEELEKYDASEDQIEEVYKKLLHNIHRKAE